MLGWEKIGWKHIEKFIVQLDKKKSFFLPVARKLSVLGLAKKSFLVNPDLMTQTALNLADNP
jgi:hypothetical protein